MNIKKLKEIINELPDEMAVFLAERKTEFTYGLVNSARVKEINLSEEPDSETMATEKVLVLDEE